MTTVDIFLDAVAQIESSNNPHAWGDGDRAVGTYQVHIDRLFDEAKRYQINPKLGEPFNDYVKRILSAIFVNNQEAFEPAEIAMYWHLGHWAKRGIQGWDLEYESKFNGALARATGRAIS